MKKMFDFPGGVHANSFDAGPLVTAPMWVIREAAGACIASEAGRQTFQRVCLVVVHALVAGEVDASCRRHEIEGLTEAAARQRGTVRLVARKRLAGRPRLVLVSRHGP